MEEIEVRREFRKREPDYGGKSFTEEQRAQGGHRDHVGGLWEEMGDLQRDFLVEQGLTPSMRFLDVGCGALRAGRRLVDYLEPGHYYGIDIGAEVLRIGYAEELSEEQRARMPVRNLRVTDRFDADFGVRFDMAIAQSLFTHIPLNAARVCLWRIAKVMRPGGRFFVTFNEAPRDTELDAQLKGKLYSDHNVYWCYRRDLRWIAERTPFRFRYLGSWGHPRGQRMVEYTRE